MKIRRNTLVAEVLAVGLLFSLALYLGAQNRVANFPSSGTDVIAFGDSLIEGVGSSRGGGFVKMLSADIGQPIINLGRSGDTTKMALERISVLDNYDPKVVILLAGGNDYLTGVPIETTKANLGRIIDEIHSRGASVLLLGLQTSVLDGKHREMFKELAQENDVAYVPDIMRGVFGVKSNMSDSLHPNDSGYRIITNRVRPALESLVE